MTETSVNDNNLDDDLQTGGHRTPENNLNVFMDQVRNLFTYFAGTQGTKHSSHENYVVFNQYFTHKITQAILIKMLKQKYARFLFKCAISCKSQIVVGFRKENEHSSVRAARSEQPVCACLNVLKY